MIPDELCWSVSLVVVVVVICVYIYIYVYTCVHIYCNYIYTYTSNTHVLLLDVVCISYSSIVLGTAKKQELPQLQAGGPNHGALDGHKQSYEPSARNPLVMGDISHQVA